jgi:hypothetical protein
MRNWTGRRRRIVSAHQGSGIGAAGTSGLIYKIISVSLRWEIGALPEVYNALNDTKLVAI